MTNYLLSLYDGDELLTATRYESDTDAKALIEVGRRIHIFNDNHGRKHYTYRVILVTVNKDGLQHPVFNDVMCQ